MPTTKTMTKETRERTANQGADPGPGLARDRGRGDPGLALAAEEAVLAHPGESRLPHQNHQRYNVK